MNSSDRFYGIILFFGAFVLLVLQIYLHVIKIRNEKNAKKDSKKSYNEGEEPSFKGWDKGDIDGLELPDFKLVKKDKTEVTIKEILNGKPAFIVFAKIPPAAGSGITPMFWHIENIMYNYFPPRIKR